jgi:hypothetical protein
MNWFSNLNTGEIVSRDRSFRVALRTGPDAEPSEFDVEAKADALWRMALHGPVGLVANAHIVNEATRIAPAGFGWWGDAIEEIPVH